MAAPLPESIDTFVTRIEKLRTSAGVAQRVLRLVDSPDFNVHQVVCLLETDPALAAQILRLVNSSYFGLPRKVASLHQAVCLLGVHTLRLTLLNHGVLQCLARNLPAPRREDFLRNSLTVATVAEKLVHRQGLGNPDEAYCAGLIVDVGALAFAQVAAEQYEPLFMSHSISPALAAAEQDCFGFDHAALGAKLLQQWKLPESIVTAVARHHEFPRGALKDETAIQIAVLVAEVLWTPNSAQVSTVRDLLAQYYDFDVDDFIALCVECQQSLKDNAATMDVALQDEINLDELRQKALEMFVAESVAAAVELDGLNSLVEAPLPPML